MLKKIFLAITIFCYPNFCLSQSQSSTENVTTKSAACPAMFSAAKDEKECWAYQAYMDLCLEHELFPMAKAYTENFCKSSNTFQLNDTTDENTFSLDEAVSNKLEEIITLKIDEMFADLDNRISKKLIDELATLAFDMKLMINELNNLNSSNVQLLTVFIENIVTMNEGVGNLQEPFSQLAALKEHLEKIGPDVAKLSKTSVGVSEQINGMNLAIDQAFEEIKMAQADQTVKVSQKIDKTLATKISGFIEELDARVSLLNGELAMATTDNIDSALKDQAVLFREVTTDFMAVIRSGIIQGDPEADKRMQALMDTQSKLEERIGELNKRLLKASQRPKPKPQQPKRQAARAPSQDVINFP